MRSREPLEVVYVDRGGDSSAKWLFWGACLGAGLALLYAPRSGEDTRRGLQRRLWKLRAMTEEKVDELVQQYVPGRRRATDEGSTGEMPLSGEFPADDLDDGDGFDSDEILPPGMAAPRPVTSAREELERRLADARARRRRDTTPSGGFEEPLA